MLEKDQIMEIPAKQRMERQETLAKEKSEEYKAALQRAVTLDVPHAISPSRYGTFDDDVSDASLGSSSKNGRQETLDELMSRLFDNDGSGHIVLKRSHSGL